MAIDSPIDAVESQYPKPSPNPLALALFSFELAFPPAAPLLKLLELLKEHHSAKGMQERMEAFWAALRDEQKFLEADFGKLRLKVEDLAEAVQLALLRDSEAFNDNKRERYLKILGNAVRSEEQIQDLAGFIHDVEVLGESDVTVLKVLNKVMNKLGDWKEANGQKLHKLHPNAFIHKRQELTAHIAAALGQKTEVLGSGSGVQTFSREEGYSICARLQGFGLAHEVQVSDREVPISDYCFRPSQRALMLLKLLGEDVPNWEHYFPPQ